MPAGISARRLFSFSAPTERGVKGLFQVAKAILTAAEELAQLASAAQQRRTGHAPTAVTVVMGEETVVITLHGALSPAEKALSRTPEGAAQVQEFHRQLFANSIDGLRSEIERITGRTVREMAAEIETATGAVVHAFTSGAMVQVYQLAPRERTDMPHPTEKSTSINRANDDGSPVFTEVDPDN